jgi:hypothetical protein
MDHLDLFGFKSNSGSGIGDGDISPIKINEKFLKRFH